MGMPIVNELHREVKRLCIAGSRLSEGDFGLKKLLPQVKKLGESAKVFERIAGLIEDIIESKSGETTEKLAELASVINAVLYTQVETGEQGDMENIETAGCIPSTRVSYRRLKPVLEALTTRGPGRYEIIRKAFEEGLFNDTRLIKPAAAALDDTYPEISEYVFKNIIPSLGKNVLPVLIKSFDISGGKGHGRRLELISFIKGEEGRGLYLEAMEKGSADVKIGAVKAIKCLPDKEDILIQQAGDRKKEVRQAVYTALAAIDSQRASEVLFKAFTGKDFDISRDAAAISREEGLAELFVDELKNRLPLVKQEKPSGEDVNKCLEIIRVLSGKNSQKAVDFLKSCLRNEDVLYSTKLKYDRGYGGVDTLARAAADTLAGIGSKDALEFLESMRNERENHIIGFSFEASVRSRTPEEVYDMYLPCFKKWFTVKENTGIIRAMENLIRFRNEDMYPFEKVIEENYRMQNLGRFKSLTFDRRWVKLLMDIDQENLVCRLAQKGDRDVVKYLLKKLSIEKSLTKPDVNAILYGLYSAGFEGIDSLIIECLKKTDIQRVYYFAASQSPVLRLLSPQCSGEIQEVADSTANTYVKEELIRLAEYIKNKGAN